jgi:hypothetical protein
MSTCKVKPNAIRDLKREGAVSNDMEILDVEKFDSLNIQYTDLARVKYNMSSPGLLFDKRIKTATAMTDETGAQKYYAVANAPLFDELQRNFESMEVVQKQAPSAIFQKPSTEGQIASEKTIRDLAARMSARIGFNTKFISDRTQKFKGRLDGTTAIINLAYATLDTPIHEILGHPIIRAIKNKKSLVDKGENIKEEGKPFQLGKIDLKETNQLYQNLLKELEYGVGKEVFDRVKRDYQYKNSIEKEERGFEILDLTPINTIFYKQKGYPTKFTSLGSTLFFDEEKQSYVVEETGQVVPFSEIKQIVDKYTQQYTLEEQQEEAIVELLGMMTANRLNAVKDGKLISLLKRLLKEMKAFIRQLIGQKEVEIDKLPDNMTLGDLADILAYSNSKLILPGYEVKYTTPDNMSFKTYAEASNYISQLVKSIEDVDLSKIELDKPFDFKGLIDPVSKKVIEKVTYFEGSGGEFFPDENMWEPGVPESFEVIFQDGSEETYDIDELYSRPDESFNFYIRAITAKNTIKDFIKRNKEYEQAKEIIETWKKENNIVYNPEEIYSRGQEFVSVVGAYSNFDVDLMMQNLLQHIDDNEKAGGEFTISAFTKPVDKRIRHLEGGGGKIKFKIYPKSKDIKWAANKDVYSGSVWDASEKVSKDKKSELLGVSYSKYPSLTNITDVQPNLANVVDNLVHHHNELGISLTGGNFRLEYDEDIPNTTKKIIDSVNSILDQKYGKLVKPKIEKVNIPPKIKDWRIVKTMMPDGTDGWVLEYYTFSALDEPEVEFFTSEKEAQSFATNLFSVSKSKIGIAPIQTKDNTTSIESFKAKVLRPKTFKEELEILLAIEPFGLLGNQEQRLKYLESLSEEELNEQIIPKKDYTEQALINTKIAKLKEIAKKYPRSLIRSEVVNSFMTGKLFAEDELPFQKVLSEQPFIEQAPSEALPVLLQIKGDTESSKASPQVVALMKDFLRRIGVDVKKLENINIDGVSTDVNGAALVMQKLILVAEGKEDVALSEEAMHFAVEIIEQTDPALFNKLMKEINSYRMLNAVIREYGQMKDYQTKDGKPDIRKLKKEAIAKVLVETIIKRSQGSTEKPELLEKTESWWQSIINALKRLFSSSGFDEAAMKVLKGEAIGTVDDIRANPDTIYYQQNLTLQQKVVNKIKDVHRRMSKPPTEKGKYTIDGREIKNRVSDISKTWYENRFADKDLTKNEYDKAVDDLLKEKGTLLHGKNEVILKNHLLDENGQYIKDRNKRKDDSYYISQLSVSDAKFYEMLKLSMEKRLESFPEGTVFLAETMVYDPKRDLAGTIDFIAVEPSGKTHLLDWKFVRISNVEQQSDIPWYKVGAWRKQMGNYKNILRFAYDIKFDGTEQTRMVPFRAVYTRGNKKENIKPELINLEIGDVDLTNEERAYLLPVGLEDELTGDRRIDDLIAKLNSVYDMLSSAKVSVDEKRNKAEQLNELYKAIRQLKTRKNFIPLITQAGILNKDIRKVIDEYYTKWEGKPLTSFSRAERNEFSRRILQYENSLKVYTTLYKNLKNVFVGDLTEREQKLKDQLKEVTETANDLEIDLEDVRKGFAENIIAKSENILDYLLPEKVITGFSSWFGTTSILQNKSAQVLYKMANRAFGFASMETVEQGNILKGIKERYDKWATSKGLTSKNYFSYIKKKDSNYLIDEYEKEFYIDLKKNTKDKNHQWVIDNIDVDAYKEFLKNKKEEEYERAKNKTRFGDEETINRQIAADIKNIDSLFDTSTDKSNGWLLYDYARKFPKEKWKTPEWVELHRKDGSGQYVNAPALEFYEYIRERNEKYETIGYINGKQTRNFLPFVRKSLMEKIVMGGDWRVGENLLRQITVSEGDVGYGQLDPIEKTPIYSIPKYFTRDTGEETSEDLFKNMTLLNEMAIRYEYLNEIESQMNLLIRTESNKEAIKTSFFGKTMVKPDGSIELTSDNSKNTQLVRDMTEAIIYGHKFVENENFDQLLIGLGNFGKRANEKLGRKIFPESFDNSRISLNKSAMWINNVFQLKALGLNPLSAISTLFGGSFQSIINAGVYFTKSDFVRNEFTLVQRMHGTDAKKYVGALQYFLPLTENYNNIIAKDLSLNRLDEGALQENLMILMRKADQYVQSVNFFSYLDNTIVENGELLNVREYLRKTPEYSALYSTTGEQRTSLEKKFEEDVKKLIAEKGVMNVAKIEGDKFVIPGVEQKSETVISLRRKVQSITKDALGNLSEDDLRRINLNIYGKSFMVFKNWIPRLVDVRFGNLKYNVASDAYEWGRTRMVFRLLTEDIVKSANSLKNSMFFGDNTAWIEQMRSLYEKKKNDYERDTGKPLRMTEEEFFQLATMNVRNQATDLLFYLALYGLLVLVKSLDDDEEDRAMRNRYRYMARMVDKITDEVAYFYNPAQLLKLTKSGIFPSVGLVENWVKTVENFGKEMYAIGVGDEELEKKNYVIKYFMKGLPITSALFDTVLLLFYPDLAKDLGMRAQSEARPIGF